MIRNSIIAGNVCGFRSQAQSSDCNGTLESLGHNLLGDGTNCSGLTDGIAGDVVGFDWKTVLESGPLNPADPLSLLIPLLDRNGGTTPTVALLPDSPAIDAIPSEDCTDEEGNAITTDQRGVARPQGEACDIGAFEFSSPRGAGFWAHQCRDRRFYQVSPEEMESLFQEIAGTSSVFPECAPIDCEFLVPRVPRNDLRVRAQQALLDVWLNLASGRLTRGRPISLPGLTDSTTVTGALSELEMTVCDPKATRFALANARDLAEALNGDSDDLELIARESTIRILPGATRTVTLGLVNLSPSYRDYSLTASGPWPVQLSPASVHALGSGRVALITVTVRAPRGAQGQTVRIHVVATDLLTSARRKVTLTFKVAGGAPNSKQPEQRQRQTD